MKIKSQKGSIALFVLIALLFYMGFLLLLYASNLNKIQTITEKTDILKGIYRRNIDNINDVYNTEMAKKDNIKPIIKDIPTTINVGETEIEDPYVEYGASGGTTEYKVFNRTFDTIGDIVNHVEENNSYGKQAISITATGNNDLITQKDIEIEFIYVPYIKLEYIESTGKQYIDTGIKPNISNATLPKIECKYCITDLTEPIRIFGCANNSNLYFQLFLNISPSLHTYQFFRTDWNKTSVPFPMDTNFHNVTFDFINSVITIDDDIYEMYFLDRQININIHLFGRNSNGTNTLNGNTRIAEWSYDDGTQIIDLIPVIRKSDSKVCMYDKVSGEFFENQGTGEFVTGPVVGNASE